MHRAADEKAVRLLQESGRFVDPVVKHAAVVFAAEAAAQAAVSVVLANADPFCLHALSVQGLADLLQGAVGAALEMGAAADHQNFICHFLSPYFLYSAFTLLPEPSSKCSAAMPRSTRV